MADLVCDSVLSSAKMIQSGNRRAGTSARRIRYLNSTISITIVLTTGQMLLALSRVARAAP